MFLTCIQLIPCHGFCQAQEVWLRETRQDGLSSQDQSVLQRKVFGSHPVRKTSLFREKSVSMPHAFKFRLFFPKRKAFADIHRNVSIVRSIMIRQRRSSKCNKPVITCPGRLANVSPLGASRPRVIN